MPELGHVVVIGAGLAGSRAVQELRAQGHRGRLTLLGAEPHLPYDRPPLTKGLLRGATDDTTLDVDWAALDVDVRLGVRATGLRPGVVETDAGELDHDGLVIATGAAPVRLGDGLVVRTVDEARALRSRLVSGSRVVVVGAGWVGAEVATAAAAAGCRVVVVDAADAPLAQALGPLGLRTLPWYDALGIEVRLGTAVEVVGEREVVLTGGEVLPADVTVIGIGARPDTAWLQGGPLALDRGVVVDEHLSAAPGVVAVGDCAAWWSTLFADRLRVEHWDDALQAPGVAVTTLLGGTAVYDPVPYFWSEQLGHHLQHVGHAAAADEVVHRGDPAGAEGWSVGWLAQGRLVALLAVDRPRDLVQARKLIARRATPDPGRLADPGVALKDCG